MMEDSTQALDLSHDEDVIKEALLLQIEKLKTKINNLDTALKSTQSNRQKTSNMLKEAQEKLKNFDRERKITISDHAVVRYIERCWSIDVESIREQMITPELKVAIDAKLGYGQFNVKGGRLAIENYTVVTFLPE